MSRYTSKHTGKKIDDTIDNVSNPNLLDNWYFGNAVNQRGATSGSTTGHYCIDRWLTSYGNVAGSWSLGADGLTLTPVDTAKIYQKFENVSELDGKILTASVLLSDGTLYSGTITRVNGITQVFYYDDDKFQFILDSSSEFWILVYINPLTIKAVKLELGTQQTLAHQDANGNWVLNEIPDYGEQLRRCQYYSRFFGEDIEIPCSNNGAGSYMEGTLPLTMRSGSGAISYGNSYLFLGNGTFYQVTSASVTSNGGRVKIGVNVNSQLTANQQATLLLTNCSIVFDL